MKLAEHAAPPSGAVLEWKDVLAVVLWPLVVKFTADEPKRVAEILIIDSQEAQLRSGDTWTISAQQALASVRVA